MTREKPSVESALQQLSKPGAHITSRSQAEFKAGDLYLQCEDARRDFPGKQGRKEFSRAVGDAWEMETQNETRTEGGTMGELLTRFCDPAMLESLANAIAVDFFRRLNPIEKPAARTLVARLRPDVAKVVAETYPQHWND